MPDIDVLGFFGKWRPFSNFHFSKVHWDDEISSFRVYPCVELPYQMAKTLDLAERNEAIRLWNRTKSPGKIRKWGQSCTLRPGWEQNNGQMKFSIMQSLVQNKFLFGSTELQDLLLSTGEGYLEETNTWGDTYFGVCEGKGQNMLGKILMNTRTLLRKKREDDKA